MMSKSSVIIGMAVALVLHGLVFLPIKKPAASVSPKPVKPKVVRINTELTPPARPAPQRPRTDPPAGRSAVPKPPLLKEVALPQPDLGQRTGETASVDMPDEVIPPLRIAWRSSRQLRQVAAVLGMRIVVVDTHGQIIGEVSRIGQPRLEAFEGELSQFSNRVRTLPKGFFGADLTLPAGQVTALWVLVPADLDRRFIAIQRAAIRRRRLDPEQIESMDAAFQEQDGQFLLFITNLEHG